MTIKDRNGKPIQKYHLYKERVITQDYSERSELLKIDLFSENLDEFKLSVTYECGTQKEFKGFEVYNLTNKLTHVSENEINELIEERKQKINFLEQCAQSPPKSILIPVLIDHGDIIYRQPQPGELGSRYTKHPKDPNLYIDNNPEDLS